MHIEIEDFKTGWIGLTMGIRKEEIDKFIQALQTLKQRDGHFHIRSSFDGSGGIGDIEVCIQDKNEQDNMELDISPAIYPEKNNNP